MLTALKSSESTQNIISVIRILAKNTKYVKFTGNITASVKGNRIIEDEPIEMSLSFDGTNYAEICIFWEDFGYANYKELGLFGLMSTKYQAINIVRADEFQILSDSYAINVCFTSAMA